ncbi:Permease of the drug/metabolite transporter (DMT) superfamily [Lachnospiraceae bacterium]|nr:Permease of the drug/metabolite transporter (DMT) superfamily [Lachnospiraceae bacterium]
MSMSKNVKGAILTTFGGACWGISGSVGQYLFDVQGMDSRWLVPLRLGIAGVVLLIWCLVRYGAELVIDPWKTKRNAAETVIYGLLGVSFCQFTYFLTIQLSSAAIGTILQNTSPVFILAAGCLGRRKLPGKKQILSIVLALAGVLCIATHGNLNSLSISPAAIVTGITSAFCVMIYNVIPANLLKKYPVTLLQAWAFLMGGSFFALVFQSWKIHYVPNLIGILGVAFVVLVGNVLAFTSYIKGVNMIGPEKGILYSFAEPVTAAVISTTVLKSPFTIADAAGFLLIFMMLVLISGKEKPESANISAI